MTDTDDARDPAVGSLAEETAKLLGALNGWARDQGDGLGDTVSGASQHAGAFARDVNEHLATGSAECTVCPVCRTVHAVRQLSPEVRSHLSTAVASLAQAATAMLATTAPSSSGADGSTGERGGVEHIDLDDSGDDWPEGSP